MSVYKKEKAPFLEASIRSMQEQSLPFDEFVIVKDGPLTAELDAAIDKYANGNNKFKIIQLEKNMGLGAALNIGLSECSNDLVLRMDSDDIAMPERAREQVSHMDEHPDIDVLGGYICEFGDSVESDSGRIKKMPVGQDEVARYIIRRNPLNHMTVCFRKTKVESVGGYQPMPLMEDYWLWVRLYCSGGTIDNLPKILTRARIDNGFEKRRGDKRQLASWVVIQRYMREHGLISPMRKALNIANMWAMTHVPDSFRKTIYGIIRRQS